MVGGVEARQRPFLCHRRCAMRVCNRMRRASSIQNIKSVNVACIHVNMRVRSAGTDTCMSVCVCL